MIKYYLGGKKVTSRREDSSGKKVDPRRVAMITDHINEVDGDLDPKDPLLISVLEAIGLAIEDTLIVQNFSPLSVAKTEIYRWC